MFPDSSIQAPAPDPSEPLIAVDDLAALLGLTLPLGPPLDTQVVFAARAVAAAIRSYCGRQIVRGEYAERFIGGLPVEREGEGGPLYWRLTLTEWPVGEIVEIKSGSRLLNPELAVIHGTLGVVLVPVSLAGAASPIDVTYLGGFDPLPGDLAALYVDLCRRQLLTMGATLPGVALAPVKAVTVGALKIDYAISNVPAEGALAGGPMPMTADALVAYEPTLGRFRAVRKMAATAA